MADLAPYNPQARCPKCGGDDIHTAYVSAGEAGWYTDDRRHVAQSGVKVEHLDRYCRRCSYGWAEACVDA